MAEKRHEKNAKFRPKHKRCKHVVTVQNRKAVVLIDSVKFNRVYPRTGEYRTLFISSYASMNK